MEELIQINERIRLSPFEQTDRPNLVRYLNDPVVYRNTLHIPSPYTEENAEQWLEITRQNREKYDFPVNWAIRYTDEGVIGGIGAMMKTGKEGHRDEIGYWLAEPFRGQGIMTDVVRAFCDWLFENRPLVRIEATVYAYNPASARVLEKAGFEREGFARKFAQKDGAFIDAILMARIKE